MLWENVEPMLGKLDAATGEEKSTESCPAEACGTSCESYVKVSAMIPFGTAIRDCSKFLT